MQTFIYAYTFTNWVYKLFANCFDNQAKAVNPGRQYWKINSQQSGQTQGSLVRSELKQEGRKENEGMKVMKEAKS